MSSATSPSPWARWPNGYDIEEWLCLRCAVHLVNPALGWPPRTVSECGVGDKETAWLLGQWEMKTTEVEEEATCERCRRDRASRLYLTALTASSSG